MRNWGDYARRWQTDTDWPPVEDASVKPVHRRAYLESLGDEWGDKASVDQVVRDYLLPSISKESTVLEIGSGGGRIARRVAPHSGLLICLDVELEMLRLCRRATEGIGKVVLLATSSEVPQIPLAAATVDFAYTFDVLVHLDQRTIYRYLLECARVLKEGARLVLHFASHETEDGWGHFVASVEGGDKAGAFGSFEYTDSRSVLRMTSRLGFECEGTSRDRSRNVYYERDILLLLRRR